jgi:NAD(P)-dependent dehydrogenase (short-subunit alcohol dehydrogenase family)
MQTIIITGASQGIGQAIAKRLDPEYKIINFSRTVVDSIETYQTDIMSHQEIISSFEKVVNTHGVPFALINCAGFVEPKGLLEITEEEWYRTINVNLSGTFFCIQEFVKYTKNSGGKIINIASTAGTRAQPGWSAYAASKAGVINLSMSMSEELKPYGIRVYCISPGRCATELRKKLAPDEDPTKIMQPEEVADFVYFLIHDGELIDGQNIRVRGN